MYQYVAYASIIYVYTYRNVQLITRMHLCNHVIINYLILSRSPNCRSNLRRSSSMMSCCFSARPALSASSPGSSSTLRAHSSRSFNCPFSCSMSSERRCCWASVEPYKAASKSYQWRIWYAYTCYSVCTMYVSRRSTT